MMKMNILLKSIFIFLLGLTVRNELYAQRYTLSFRAEDEGHYNCLKGKLGSQDIDLLFDLWEHSLRDDLLNRIYDLKEQKDIVVFKNKEKKEHWYILDKNPLPPTNHILVKLICTGDTYITFFYSEINGVGTLDKQRSKRISENAERLIKTNDIDYFIRNFVDKIYPKDPYKDYEITVKSTFNHIDNNKLSNEDKIEEYREIFNQLSPFRKRFQKENHDLYYRHAVDYYTLSVQQNINAYNEETEVTLKEDYCSIIIESYFFLMMHCKAWNINKCQINFTEEREKWEKQRRELEFQSENKK